MRETETEREELRTDSNV